MRAAEARRFRASLGPLTTDAPPLTDDAVALLRALRCPSRRSARREAQR